MARGETLSSDDVQWILSLADAYDQPDADVEALLKKSDGRFRRLWPWRRRSKKADGERREIAGEQNAIFGQFGQERGRRLGLSRILPV